MSNNNKRPGIFSETQRVKLIGVKMRELAFLLNSDESFVGQFAISKIAGPDNKLPTRIVAVQSPKKFYQLDEVDLTPPDQAGDTPGAQG